MFSLLHDEGLVGLWSRWRFICGLWGSMNLSHCLRRAGFTLIELLIVVLIGTLFVGGGIAAYNNFDKKQRIVAGGRGLVVTLRDAQKRAVSGEKPVGCGTLVGWSVRLVDVLSYSVEAKCDNGVFGQSTINLQKGTVFSGGSFDVGFAVITGNVTGSGQITLTDDGGGNGYVIEVTDAGAVGDLGFSE